MSDADNPNEKPIVWEVTHVPWRPDDDRLKAHLADGWEPFAVTPWEPVAVTPGRTDPPTVWLRRLGL